MSDNKPNILKQITDEMGGDFVKKNPAKVELIKHSIIIEKFSFYETKTIGEKVTVITSPTLYAEFFIQEKFKRIATPDDKILLLQDTNNVVKFFNHNTDTVYFLTSKIDKENSLYTEICNRIAKENFSVIRQGFQLIPSIELKYYLDTKNTFGLPFKNGFFLQDENGITKKDYTDVNGFFSPHEIQTRNFKYTKNVGMFEKFLIRASIGREVANTQDTLNIVESFYTMFGYMCHNYKDYTKSPCIVLTDADADDESRNGGRGKSLMIKGLEAVKNHITKGGKEFDPNYTFVFADLEKKHKLYIIDDVPPAFRFDDLYTNILGHINAQRKGAKAELIDFKDTPKFIISSNWIFKYSDKDASTIRRSIEYKFTDYYNNSHKPEDDFKCVFFQDWKANEWNKFYSFVFRCVKLYIEKGIIKTHYNKSSDNFKAYFYNDGILNEFDRCIKYLFEKNTDFTVNDFLAFYNILSNPLRLENMFTIRNTKILIDAYLGTLNNKNYSYSKRERKWKILIKF